MSSRSEDSENTSAAHYAVTQNVSLFIYSHVREIIVNVNYYVFLVNLDDINTITSHCKSRAGPCAEEEADLIRQEAAIKASRTVLARKKELEAATLGLEAVRKVLEFSDVGESVFGEYQDPNKEHLMERYLNENMRMNAPPPDPVLNEIPSPAIVDAHDIKVSEPIQNSLISVVPQVLQQTNTKQDTVFDLAKAVCENIRTTNARNPERALTQIWERLDLEYGSPEAVEHAMKQRIINFTPLMENDRKRYFDLYDLAAEVESLKSDEAYGSAFAYFDSTTGINDFVRKLPKRFREKWMTTCDKYKVNNGVSYVPFQVLVNFLRDLARLRNDPGLILENLPQNTTTQHPPQKKSAQKSDVFVRKTTVAPDRLEYETDSDISYVRCPIHGGNSNHALRDCQKLCKKPYKERIDFLFKKGYCLKCCGQKRHLKKNCHESVKCERCNSTEHVTILHPDSAPRKVQEGEQPDVNACCTEICKVPRNTSKSCSKIVLVSVFPEGERYRERTVYCLIDNQSNRSLASPSFFDAFNIRGPETEYVLSTCTGRSVTSGRKASGYVVRSLDGSCTLTLPSLIECDEIPDNRNEIPSKAVARGYSHLQDIEKCIPEIDESVNIELLIGRDLITAHHVLDQRIGTDVLPFGQKLPLGWVIIGNVCLECDIFTRLPCDEKPGLSIEDKKFLHFMESSFHRSSDGFWEEPLPFREGRQPLPDNRSMALHRAKSFDANLRSNTEKKKQVIEFVEKLLQNEHAELAPKLPVNVERWYLPMFAVFHPKKPESIRVVFDSSAKYQDVSLNSVLLQGPDLLNSLVGILFRFRQEKVAITMDVQHMFYNFKVPEEQRCYLRFIWHQNNDFNQPLVDYQMTRHVFGNTASPAVANYGFRKVVETADQDVQNLIRAST
ncbi:uncharacterized protein LOC134247040 [Saccostrea cucullata]|uniref:uncharacterized protein LOC134247040 n=1 Tax=Saccostrea cuccullata TaxID=36930 RepID=UPI002ED5A1F0